ncbi:MAG: FecR domain-containing protein [Xanthobacteraceae bacterium]
MKRREFLKLLSGAFWPAIWPFAARAQYPGSPYPSATSPYQAPPNQSNPPATPAANQSAVAVAPDDKSVGQVSTLNGHCTAMRGTVAAVALKVSDHIFENDTLQSDLNSTLGITFDDETTFSLSANTRIVVDKFVYEESASGNAASFHVATGTAAFVASLVAKTGDMKISTDNATLGIRGTTGVVEVPTAGGTGTPAIKLYPDTDGHVGRIEVFDRQGGRLGTLTQGASGFSLRPGPNGRIMPVLYQIPPQEAARDRGVLQRLNPSQAIGRQIAVQRRQIHTLNRNGKIISVLVGRRTISDRTISVPAGRRIINVPAGRRTIAGPAGSNRPTGRRAAMACRGVKVGRARGAITSASDKRRWSRCLIHPDALAAPNGDHRPDFKRHQIFADFERARIGRAGFGNYVGNRRGQDLIVSGQYEMGVSGKPRACPQEHHAGFARRRVMADDTLHVWLRQQSRPRPFVDQQIGTDTVFHHVLVVSSIA